MYEYEIEKTHDHYQFRITILYNEKIIYYDRHQNAFAHIYCNIC